VSSPLWDPMYEEEDRPTVPDRSGQVWVIECGGYSVHLVIGPPKLAVFNNHGDRDKRWRHPTLDLTTGSPRSIAEWTLEPWSTRDSGSWKRIT
jgi:hypothetical protein